MRAITNYTDRTIAQMTNTKLSNLYILTLLRITLAKINGLSTYEYEQTMLERMERELIRRDLI